MRRYQTADGIMRISDPSQPVIITSEVISSPEMTGDNSSEQRISFEVGSGNEQVKPVV